MQLNYVREALDGYMVCMETKAEGETAESIGNYIEDVHKYLLNQFYSLFSEMSSRLVQYVEEFPEVAGGGNVVCVGQAIRRTSCKTGFWHDGEDDGRAGALSRGMPWEKRTPCRLLSKREYMEIWRSMGTGTACTRKKSVFRGKRRSAAEGDEVLSESADTNMIL